MVGYHQHCCCCCCWLWCYCCCFHCCYSMRKVHEKVKLMPGPHSVDQFAIKYMLALSDSLSPTVLLLLLLLLLTIIASWPTTATCWSWCYYCCCYSMRKVHEKVKPVPAPHSVDQFAIKFMVAITSTAAADAVTKYSKKKWWTLDLWPRNFNFLKSNHHPWIDQH